MKKYFFFCILLLALFNFPLAEARNETLQYLNSLSLEELMQVKVVVGTRGNGKPVTESLQPVAVITAEEIARTGYTELGKALQRLLPAFNFPLAYLSDGTDHVRPFTLRGMGSDQVLVLINGKRRHPTALLHLNASIGRGSTGVDINMIPIVAIARVELLRDGAAAQYGSDAIAGIINIVLKETVTESVQLATGQTIEGDGEVGQLSFSAGHEFNAERGFITVHGEVRHRGDTNRSGLDRRPYYFTGDPRNEQPSRVTHHVGDPEADNYLMMLNAELDQYYAHASAGYRESSSGGFFRRPLDNRNVRTIYPDGFLPHIAPTIRDLGLTVGARNTTANQWRWDASYTLGWSEFQFEVENSLNTSLGAESPTEFDSGTLQFHQHLINVEAFKTLNIGLANALEVGVGAEFRQENFAIEAGEPDSYRHGGVPILDGPNAGQTAVAGAQVFPGFKPSNEVSEHRHNTSLYIDVEYPVTEALRTQAAVRYENYSDFGPALSGKLSAAYRFKDAWLMRASTSTGFRAPSLAQSHYTSTSTGFLGDNVPLEIGTFNVNHPLARALGATDLTAEESQHFSTGVSYQPSNRFFFSLDYFYTRIDNRILLSANILQNEALYGPEVIARMKQYGVLGARFFTNAADTETQGLDATLKYEWHLPKGRLNLSAQYHLNRTRIRGAVRAPSILGNQGPEVILSRSERVQRIEEGQPRDIILLTGLYEYQRWAFNVRLQRFGKYRLVNDSKFPELDRIASVKWITDLDLSYQFSSQFHVAIGAHNVFDVYPDTTTPNEFFNGPGNIIPYTQNDPFGFNGAFYYVRLGYQF